MSVPSISIENKHGVAMLIDESDLGLLTQHKKGHWCFYVHLGYALLPHKKSIGGNGQIVAFHRLIMKASVGLEVNHINGNKLDNRKENLQICTRSEHRMGTVGYGASKFKGVYKVSSKWRSGIWNNGKLTHIGTFATELEAAQAYDAAARLQGCEFRLLNFPNEGPNVNS